MSRTNAREVVLKATFQIDFQPEKTEEMYLAYMEEYDLEGQDAEYAKKMIKGIVNNIEAIDNTINAHLINWDMTRLNKVEAAILRLATLEIMECDDIPAPVSISEAINLTIKYSDQQSTKYINAVLEKIARMSKKKETLVNTDENEKSNRQ